MFWLGITFDYDFGIRFRFGSGFYYDLFWVCLGFRLWFGLGFRYGSVSYFGSVLVRVLVSVLY